MGTFRWVLKSDCAFITLPHTPQVEYLMGKTSSSAPGGHVRSVQIECLVGWVGVNDRLGFHWAAPNVMLVVSCQCR